MEAMVVVVAEATEEAATAVATAAVDTGEGVDMEVALEEGTVLTGEFSLYIHQLSSGLNQTFSGISPLAFASPEDQRLIWCCTSAKGRTKVVIHMD